jgi:TonB family protein
MARLPTIILAGATFALLVVRPGPPAFAQTAEEVLHSYVGQKLILRGFGDKGKANVKRENLSKRARGCDAAVEVKEADLKEDELRLRLDQIGSPMILNEKTRTCSAHPDETILTVSGIGKQEPPGAISEVLGQIVQTPEVYLTTHGVTLRSQRGQTNAPVVELTNSSETPPGISRPRPLLIVNARYSEDARRQRIQGDVRVAIEVGTNGLIQRARILKGVHPSLDRQVLRVLPLFRFEPGKKDNEAVVVRTVVEMSFRFF